MGEGKRAEGGNLKPECGEGKRAEGADLGVNMADSRKYQSLPPIPYGCQSIDDDDIAAVIDALRSDWLTCGPKVAAFEAALAQYCGAKHAIAVSNGTAALHVAMLAAGIKPGDRALTSANTFLASANCAEFVGATADFADINPRSYNVTAETLATAWRDDVRAVVAVDFAGQPCDMPAIYDMAHARGAIVIEDAAHSLGSTLDHQGQRHRVGGHPWADMTTLSFHPVKTITTGEGGAILTNDDSLAERCRSFRSHGMIRGEAMGQRPQTANRRPETKKPGSLLCDLLAERGPWLYEMHEVGYNYRVTDIQCALGLSQLTKLERFIQRRAEIVARYNGAFAFLPLVRTPQVPGFGPPPSRLTQVSGSGLYPSRIAWHLYVLQIDFAALGKPRTQVMNELRQCGIGTQVHYIPVHLQPYYGNKYGYGPGKCPQAESYYSRCLSLPLFPTMTDHDADRVIQSVREVTQGSGIRTQVSL